MSKFNAFILGFLIIVGCTSPGKRTAVGAGVGAGAGAAIGALVGSQSGNAGTGALIGAGIGASVGGVVGNRMDRQAKELAKLAEVRRTENGLVAQLKSDILFEPNSVDLRSHARENVDKIGSILRKYPENIILVVGHTDSDGPDAYNQSLSERRALAVASRIVDDGVSSGTVQSKGEGEKHPIADNITAQGKSKNRRVELQISIDPNRVPKK